MVAKISTGGNMFGALAYNQNKVDSGEAKVLFSNRMLLSEDGNFSIGECMRSFEMQMPVQLSTKKPILHISINPHPEDVLTDQLLSDIAKEYMRKLGYGDQPYLVYKHTDIVPGVASVLGAFGGLLGGGASGGDEPQDTARQKRKKKKKRTRRID